jgi:protein SCO1/2
MKKLNWKKYIGLIGILFLFPLILLLIFGKMGNHHFGKPKYFGPNAMTGADTTDYQLPPFVFTNQSGEAFASDSLQGKIWVAAFYSLTDSNAAKITERLLNINFKYRVRQEIAIVAFSTNPSADTPEALSSYINQVNRYNIKADKWQFLTGQSSVMESFMRNAFLIEDIRNEAIFRLVDHHGQIRGLYGNTEYHMEDLMEDISAISKSIKVEKYNKKHENDK